MSKEWKRKDADYLFRETNASFYKVRTHTGVHLARDDVTACGIRGAYKTRIASWSEIIRCPLCKLWE
jgi:hypothetical protein